MVFSVPTSLAHTAVTGLDAIEKVLKTARKEGTKNLGHDYRKSMDGGTGHQI